MGNFEVQSYRLNKFLGLTKILTLLNYEQFSSSLSQNMYEHNELFLGFKFYVKSICRNIMETISRGDFLFLKENIVIRRANFHGVPLSKLKNTCQKIIFLKNTKKLFESLYDSKNKEEYMKNFAKTEALFISMVEKYKKYICIAEEFENEKIDDLILNIAIFWNYIDYNDTGGGGPKGYIFSLEETSENARTLSLNQEQDLALFEGYKYTLVYIWNELLSKEQKIVFPSEMIQTKNWKELDNFFGKIRTSVIVPLEKNYSLSRNTFFYLSDFNESIIPPFFFKSADNPTLSFMEELEQLFLWYPVQALPSEDVFSGADSCVITIEGNIALKFRTNIEEKVLVIRFKHPKEHGNAFSYAVLIDAFGTIADYSGWLLFYNIGAESGGFSYSSYMFVEETISSYPDGIEITECEIESKELLRYINSKSFNIKDVIEGNKINQNVEQMLSEALSSNSTSQEKNRKLLDLRSLSRGLILELFAYYYFNCEGGTTYLRYKNFDLIGQTDLDVISQRGNEVLIISCMCSFDIRKIVKLNQIVEKIRVQGLDIFSDKNYDYKPAVFMLKTPTLHQRRVFEEYEISTFVLDELKDSEPCFTRIDIPEIKRLLFNSKQ